MAAASPRALSADGSRDVAKWRQVVIGLGSVEGSVGSLTADRESAADVCCQMATSLSVARSKFSSPVLFVHPDRVLGRGSCAVRLRFQREAYKGEPLLRGLVPCVHPPGRGRTAVGTHDFDSPGQIGFGVAIVFE